MTVGGDGFIGTKRVYDPSRPAIPQLSEMQPGNGPLAALVARGIGSAGAVMPGAQPAPGQDPVTSVPPDPATTTATAAPTAATTSVPPAPGTLPGANLGGGLPRFQDFNGDHAAFHDAIGSWIANLRAGLPTRQQMMQPLGIGAATAQRPTPLGQ